MSKIVEIAEHKPVPLIREAICTVRENTPVNSQYRHLVLDAPPDILDCQPGQFFHLLCRSPSGPGPFFRRPMSIYGFDAGAGTLSFLYKVAGEGTGVLATLAAGDPLSVVGPLGIGFTIPDTMRHPLLVARGVGLATLAPLALALRERGLKATAICSARSAEFLMSVSLFRSWGLEVITISDDEGSSSVENLREVVEGLMTGEGVDGVYTCGSKRITRLLKALCARHEVFGEVALEQHMACGVGVCQACVLPFERDGVREDLRVCRDGPVFNLQEVV